MADPKTEYTVSEKENGSNGSKHDKTKSNEKKSNKKEKKKMHGKDKTKEPKVKGKKGKKGKDTNKCEKIEQTVFSKVLNPKPKKDEKPNVRVSGFERDFEFHITSFTTGRQLFDMVIDQVNIREVWFFGLSFVDSKGYMAWLKLKKKVFSQDVGKRKPIHFRFLAKFYPEDVSKELYEPATKMHFYLQIQDSILSSKIFCPPETAVLLASYDCQHRFGDYTPDIHKRGFLADETVLPDKTLETYDMTAQQWEERIVSFYKDHSGMSSDTAVTEYLKVSQDLEMYGVNYFEIRNKKGTELMLGVDAMGLNVYEKDNKLTPKIGFPWSEIRAISFNDKKLIIKPVDDKIPDPDLKLEINSQTNSCCACVSQTKNFAFYTHKVRANKDILALCMGNHELYMRRRQTTTGKEDGGQTEGASGEAGNANKQANVSNSPPVSLSTSNQGTSAKSSPMPSLIGKTALTSESPAPQTSPCISDHNSDYQRPDHCKPLSVTPIHDGEFSERAIDVPCVEELKVTFSEDETEEIFRPQSPEEDYDVDEEIPILTPKPTRTPTPLASEPAAESRNGSRLSHYDPPEPKIEVTLVKEVQENLEPEKDLESKDTAKCKAKEVLWDTSVEGEATMNNNILERTPEVEKNQETYEKLVHLYENLSKKEKRKNRENHIHRKMKNENIDKYKTLQKIREGNTKERISIFEAM